MKRSIFVVVLLFAAVGAGTYYFKRGDGAQATATRGNVPGNPAGGPPGGGPGFGGGGFGGPGGGGFGGGQRQPMTVEVLAVARADMSSQITVVGNLIGAVTVEAVPKVAGRLESVSVRLGDSVRRGQTLAKIEDLEIQQQVKQAQAAYEVSAATIRQREADLRLAQTNLERSRNLYERQLIPKQTFDDTDSRYQAGVAQLDLANAQYAQSKARLDELSINLANTVISSPVSGFIGKRVLDPGAWVTTNSAFLSVVDISLVRLVANVVEKDIRRIAPGLRASVEVDAFPGETFSGHVARISPVLDPATRTAQIEVEIENAQYRLKPGMYAKVSLIVDKKSNVLTVPTTALVDVAGARGVFLAQGAEQGQVAAFRKVDIGIVSDALAEVVSGVSEGDRIVTTGAAALRDGDRILLPGETASGQTGGFGGGRAQNGGRRGQGGGAGGAQGGERRGGGQGGPSSGSARS